MEVQISVTNDNGHTTTHDVTFDIKINKYETKSFNETRSSSNETYRAIEVKQYRNASKSKD